MSAEVAGAVPVVTIEVTAPTGTAADDAPSAQHDEAQHDTVALRPHEGPSSPGDARRWSMLLPSWMAFGRRKALAELIATEERYVSDLRALVEGYLNRLPTEVLCDEERQIIFSNLPALYNFHRDLCAQMQRCMQRDPAHIGKLFIERAEEMTNLYSEYCSRHGRSLLTLAERQRSKSFAAWVTVCQELLKNQLSLKDDLLKPVQRVLKYHLLLAEQEKKTPLEEQGHSELMEATATMRRVAMRVNDVTRQQHLSEVMYGEIRLSRSAPLDDRLSGLPFAFDMLGELVDDYAEAALQQDKQKHSPRRLLVFEYYLMGCKRREGEELAVKELYELATCKCVSIDRSSFSITPNGDAHDASIYCVKNMDLRSRLAWLFEDATAVAAAAGTATATGTGAAAGGNGATGEHDSPAVTDTPTPEPGEPATATATTAAATGSGTVTAAAAEDAAGGSAPAGSGDGEARGGDTAPPTEDAPSETAAAAAENETQTHASNDATSAPAATGQDDSADHVVADATASASCDTAGIATAQAGLNADGSPSAPRKGRGLTSRLAAARDRVFSAGKSTIPRGLQPGADRSRRLGLHSPTQLSGEPRSPRLLLEGPHSGRESLTDLNLPVLNDSSDATSDAAPESRTSLAEFAQTQQDLRSKVDALIEDNTRLQRELAMARADSERLRLELVAANTTPETGAGNVMLTVLKKALIQQTLEQTELKEKHLVLEAKVAEAATDAAAARLAADTCTSQLKAAEFAKQKTADELKAAQQALAARDEAVKEAVKRATTATEELTRLRDELATERQTRVGLHARLEGEEAKNLKAQERFSSEIEELRSRFGSAASGVGQPAEADAADDDKTSFADSGASRRSVKSRRSARRRGSEDKDAACLIQ